MRDNGSRIDDLVSQSIARKREATVAWTCNSETRQEGAGEAGSAGSEICWSCYGTGKSVVDCCCSQSIYRLFPLSFGCVRYDVASPVKAVKDRSCADRSIMEWRSIAKPDRLGGLSFAAVDEVLVSERRGRLDTCLAFFS